MISRPSPLAQLLQCICVGIARAVLSARTIDATTTRDSLLPQVPQFVGDKHNHCLLMGEDADGKVCSMSREAEWRPPMTHLLGSWMKPNELTLAAGINDNIGRTFPVRSPAPAPVVVVATVDVSLPVVAITVLECDVESCHARRQAMLDDVPQKRGLHGGVVIESHMLDVRYAHPNIPNAISQTWRKRPVSLIARREKINI